MSDKRDLLVELGTEDLPARLLSNLTNEFGENLKAQLSDAGLEFIDCKVFCTPRRLAIIIEGLDSRQRDQQIQRKGPSKDKAFDNEGNPTQAAVGFARSCGVEVAQLEIDHSEAQPRLLFHEHKPGENTVALLPQYLETSIKRLSIPKRMRWNETGAEFIRPVRWLLVIFGTSVVPVSLFGQQADNLTYGHRFHHPASIEVGQVLDYENLLHEKGQVIADFSKRRQLIIDQVSSLAKKAKAKPAYSAALLDEITSLVEWPRALLGSFDKKFLAVHKELLINTMQDNQKYIPLLNKEGELAPKFIVISNIESKNPESVIQGNEKVIVPRFEDAMFFWKRDKGNKLEDNLIKLESVVYEKQLGTLKDKTDRMVKLSAYLSKFTHADQSHCERAAKLSKCDLVTETVAEFPKLQGIVGRNLALLNAEEQEVSQALEEQYLPLQAGGELPNTTTGQTLALADRLDTLIGIFAIGKKPTGLKDPYGLRRASLAVLRILIEKDIDLDLRQILQTTANLFPKDLNAASVVGDVYDYITERLRGYFSDQGIAIDTVDSVLANRPNSPKDIAARVQALGNFRKLPNAESLAAANKRIRNILKKIDRDSIGQVNKSLLRENAENDLNDALEKLSKDVEIHFHQHEYEQALNKLADLRQPVDTFFDDVMVMDEDEALKTNRIALLAKIDSLFMHVADFSRLQS